MKTIVWFGLVLSALSAAGKVFFRKVGSNVALECGVSNYKNTLVWHHKGNKVISLDTRGFARKASGDLPSRSTVRHNTRLDISTVKEADAGRFTCEADSRSHEHTLALVSVSVSPSGVLKLGSKASLQCVVKGLDPDPTVQWKSPDGSSPTGPLLSPVAATDAGIWQCTVTSGGETFSENVTVSVEDPTPKTTPPSVPQSSEDGREPTCPTCVTNHKSSGGQHLLGLSWWVWLAIGAGVLVVILLMVIVITLCRKIRRRKKKFLKMKNGQLKPRKYCQCDRPTAAAKPQQGRRREKPSALPQQPLLME